MATVTFSAADDVLYAYLAGEIDHDAAQGLRIQLDDALLTRSPRILVISKPLRQRANASSTATAALPAA